MRMLVPLTVGLSFAVMGCAGNPPRATPALSRDAPVATSATLAEANWFVWPSGAEVTGTPVLNPVEDIVAFLNADDHSIQLWNMRDNAAAGTLPAVGAAGDHVELSWSGDGTSLAALATGANHPPLLSLLDIKTLRASPAVALPEDAVRMLAWHRPSIVLERTASVDVLSEAGQLIRRAVGDHFPCDAKAGRLACFVATPFALVVSEISTGREIAHIDGFQQPASIELSPDGNHLLVGTDELVDVATAQRSHVDAVSGRHLWTASELQFVEPQFISEECPDDAGSWLSGKIPSGRYPDRVVGRVALATASPQAADSSTATSRFRLIGTRADALGYVDSQTGRMGCVPPPLRGPVQRWRWADPYWLELSLANGDRNVRGLWDARTATLLASGPMLAPDLALSHVIGGGEQLIRLGTGQVLATFVRSWLSRDKRVLAGWSRGSTDLEVWDLVQSAKRTTIHCDANEILDAQLSTDGEIVAVGIQERNSLLRVRVWSGVSGQMIMSTPSDTTTMTAYVLSDDGKRLNTQISSRRGEVGTVWETATGKPIFILPKNEPPFLTNEVLGNRNGGHLTLASVGAAPLSECPGHLEEIDDSRHGHPRLLCTTRGTNKDEQEVFLWDPETRHRSALAGFKPEWLACRGTDRTLAANYAYGLRHVVAAERGTLHVWPLDGAGRQNAIRLDDSRPVWIDFYGDDDALVAIVPNPDQGAKPAGMVIRRWADAGTRELPSVAIDGSVGADLGGSSCHPRATRAWLEELLAPQDASPDGAFRLEAGSSPALVRQRDGARLLLRLLPGGQPSALAWESAAFSETGEFVSTEKVLSLLRFRRGKAVVEGRLVTGDDVASILFRPTLARDFLATGRLPVGAAP